MRTTRVLAGFAALLVLSLAPPARAGEIELLSAAGMESDTAGAPGSSAAAVPALSADGRWIAHTSTAGNLVPGQTDHEALTLDVFLHDRQTGATVLVSHKPGQPAAAGDLGASQPSISADGRWIAYVSQATDLVPGQKPAANGGTFPWHVFLYDRDTGANLLVSRSSADPDRVANGSSPAAWISADGAWIVFVSQATDLIAGHSDGNGGHGGGEDVFLYERATGQIVLASRAAGAPTSTANAATVFTSASADGRYVALESQATNLVAGFSAAGPGANVFLFDRATGAATLVSRTSASATAGAGGSGGGVSPDGGFVAFLSAGANLVAGQTEDNFGADVFLFDRAAGTSVLVSHAAGSPTTTGDGEADPAVQPRVSTDGAYVVFSGRATNAVAGQTDANDGNDLFLFERATSTLTLVTRSAASPTTAGSGPTFYPLHVQLAADGSRVVFESEASDLVAGQSDSNLGPDIFVFDRASGANTLVSGSGGSAQTTGNGLSSDAGLSADGAWIAFATQASDLVAGTSDLNQGDDTILHDRLAGTSEVLTLHAPGMAAATPGGESVLLSASADGRFAVFSGSAANHMPGQTMEDWNWGGIYLVDRATGATALVSRAASSPTAIADGHSPHAAISADGAWVVFTSRAGNHVPGQSDTNREPLGPPSRGLDVFLYDRAAGTTALVSHAAGSATTAGDQGCADAVPAISEDGGWIAYACFATNLVAGQSDEGTYADVFLYDRVTGENRLVSRAAGTTATAAGGGSGNPVISADGAWVAYVSGAADLVAGGVDGNGDGDVFLFSRESGQTLLASRAAGTAATAAAGFSFTPSIDRQGRHVAFASRAGDLVPGLVKPTEGFDVFLFDRVTGAVELISRSAASPTTAGNGESRDPVVSGDGLSVAFLSQASDLLSGAWTSGLYLDVFVHDRTTRVMELVSRSAFSGFTGGNSHSERPSLTPDGRHLAFFSAADNLTPDAPADRVGSVFAYDRRSRALERVAEGSWFVFTPGEDRPRFTPLLSSDGSVVFFTSGDPWLAENDFNVSGDVFAYVRGAAPQGSDFFTVAPCRLTAGATLSSGSALLQQVHGACGVPWTAAAVAVNVTVTQATGPGRLTLHPGNLAAPLTSTLNFAAGQTRANNAVLPLALNGEGTLAVAPILPGGGTVRVFLDVSGYFQEPEHE